MTTFSRKSLDLFAANYPETPHILEHSLRSHPLLELAEPEGAFYAFPRVPGLASSLDFVRGVLAEENVGLAPGYTFGPGNEAYFRLCYAQSGERLAEALRRIVRYLERQAGAIGAR